MAPKKPDLVERWIEKAEHDLLNVRNNLQAEFIPWDTVCFHCQQAVEKYLKAALLSAGIGFPKTHDLIYLAKGLQPILPKIKTVSVDLAWLTDYSIWPRYPEETNFEEPQEKEGKHALAIARRVKRLIRPSLLKRRAKRKKK